MALSIKDIQRCISLGEGVKNKAAMGLFSMVAPYKGKTLTWWERWLVSVTPNIWIQPITLKGLKLLINPLDWSQTVIFEEVLLRNGYDLDKVEFNPEMIIDCGAHIGIFSLLAKSKFPTTPVMAFEPNPQNVSYLRRQIEGNRLDIRLFDAAVSTKTSEMNFLFHTSHSGRLDHNSNSNEGTKVQIIDLPKVITELMLSSLLLKIDVEGEELEILPILVPKLPKQAAVFFETHSGLKGWQVVSELFHSNGFRVEQINARGDFYDGFACRQ